MNRAFRLVAAAAVLATTLGLSAAEHQGVSYSTSGAIERGKWTGQYAKAASYATANHVPLVVVWVNPGCFYCNSLLAGMAGNKAFSSWMANRGYVFVLAVNGKTADSDAAYDAAHAINSKLSLYPLCFVKWKKQNGSTASYAFAGRTGSMHSSCRAGTTVEQFMNTIDLYAKDFVKSGTGSAPVAAEKSYKLSTSVSGKGTVTGAGSYKAGASVRVTATPSIGYKLTGWYRGGKKVSEEPGYTLTMPSAAVTLTAKFAVDKRTLTLVCDSQQGKVSGAGSYAYGKKVKVTATAKKGYVFAAWYEGGTPLTNVASFSAVMPFRDVTYTARFRTVEEDRAAIRATVGKWDFDAKTSAAETTVTCGVRVSWPIASSALSKTTVTVAGLPSGLKYSSKTGCIEGAPTSASKKNTKTGAVKPSTVTVSVKTAGKTTAKFILSVTVKALPSWAYGSYYGGGADGRAKITVASSGKTTGTYYSDGKTWTLSAPCYETFDEKHSLLTMKLAGKSGKLSFSTSMEAGVLRADDTIGALEGKEFSLYQNSWKAEPWKALAKKIDKAPNISYAVASPHPGTVTLKFGASGTVTAAGSFTIVKNGKNARYTCSGSTTLNAVGGDDFLLFVYFPRTSGGNFHGLVDCLQLSWGGSGFTLKR